MVQHTAATIIESHAVFLIGAPWFLAPFIGKSHPFADDCLRDIVSHPGGRGRIADPPLGPGSSCGEGMRSEEHTSELQSHSDLVCRLLLEKKKKEVEPYKV